MQIAALAGKTGHETLGPTGCRDAGRKRDCVQKKGNPNDVILARWFLDGMES
jgi:hypothetical protein